MRKTLLFTAALAMLAAPAAFAQTSSSAAAPPPPAGPTPAEKTTAPMTPSAKPMPHALRHRSPAVHGRHSPRPPLPAPNKQR